MTDNPQGSDIFNQFFEQQPEETPAPEPEKVEEVEEEIEATETEDAQPEEAAPEEVEEAEKKYSIKAAGEMHDLTIDELIEYAQKGIGFNRNSEAKAKEHRQAMAEVEEIRKQASEEYAKAASYLDILGESKAGKEHLEYLQEYDLPEYKRIKALQDEVKAQADNLKQQQINDAIGLLEERFPSEWAKTDTRAKLLGEAGAFFESLGISKDAAAKILDGVTYVAAVKAYRYDKLMQEAEKTKAAPVPKKTVKTQVPAKAKGPTSISDIDPMAEWFPNLN